MLILLSRLKPSTIASEKGDDVDPFLLMPFIRRCSIQSNLRVRLLASRALTGLVSNEKLPSVLIDIASDLPSIDNHATTCPDGSISFDTPKGHTNMSFNWIHGILLQLSSLLDTNCRNLADSSKKDQILSNLVGVLSACSWVASHRWCSCPIVSASFLKVLNHMLSIARTCHTSRSFYSIRNLLLDLSTECLDLKASYSQSYYDPTIAELCEQAAVSYFSCVFQASEEMPEAFQFPQQCLLNTKFLNMTQNEYTFVGLQERLICSLSDTTYEVRLATLKWFCKFLKSTQAGTESCDLSSSEMGIIQHWMRSNLQTTLFKLLDMENNYRCSYYILRILFTWNLLQFQKASCGNNIETIYVGGMDCDSVFLFWDKLIKLYQLTRHAKTREILICCLGICVKKFVGLFTPSILMDAEKRESIEHGEFEQEAKLGELYNRIYFFTSLIKKHSASSEPVNMRKAAAESIVASGLLEQAELVGLGVHNNKIQSENSSFLFEPKEAVNIYAHRILEIWFTCILLLEDEEDSIRIKLALDVQRCFASKRSEGNSNEGVVPSQVEKVIGLSFEYLTSIFGKWIEYFDFLLRWLWDTANYKVSRVDLVRQVFDKEIDNHHEEKLLISQICCSHLESLPVIKSRHDGLLGKQWFRDYLLKWRQRFCHQLKSFTKNEIGKHSESDWVGGLGNHKDAFLPLYANLLSFYALSNCIIIGKIEEGMSLLFEIDELGIAINPYLRNPLIFNLYMAIVKLHEKSIGATIDHLIPGRRRDEAVWDGFDPYFLLK